MAKNNGNSAKVGKGTASLNKNANGKKAKVASDTGINGILATALGLLTDGKKYTDVNALPKNAAFHVAIDGIKPEDLQKLTSVEENPNTVKITGSADTLVKKIDELIKHLPQRDTYYDAISGIYNMLVEKSKEPTVPQSSTMKVTVEGCEGLKEINEGLGILIEKLNQLTDVTMSKNVEDIIAHIDKLQELNENIEKTAVTAKAVPAKAVDIKTSISDIKGIIDETSSIDADAVAKATENVSSLILACAGAGLLLAATGFVFMKMPMLDIYVKQYTKTLTEFLMSIILPISLAALIMSFGADKNFEGISALIATASVCLILGGLAMKIVKEKDADAFGRTLSKFLFAVLLPFGLLTLIGRNADEWDKTLEAIGDFIIKATIIMTLGALFARSEKLVAGALEFGKILMVFTLVTLLPFIIGSVFLIFAARQMEEFGNFIVKATIVMLIGAAFMMIPTLWKHALLFGVMLFLFVELVLSPFIGVGGVVTSWAEALHKGTLFLLLNAFTNFVVKITLVLIVGAVFMMVPRLWMGALAFGALVNVFVRFLVKPFNKLIITGEMWTFALSVLVFIHLVKKVAQILIFGGLFMMLGGGRFAFGALLFAGLVLLFLEILVSGLSKHSAELMVQMPALKALTFVVTALAGILLIGAMFIKQDPKNALYAMEFAALVWGFTETILWAFTRSKGKLSAALVSAYTISLIVTVSAGMLMLGGWIISKIGAGPILTFGAILLGFIGAIIGLCRILSHNKKNINQALPISAELSILIATCAGALLIAAAAVRVVGGEMGQLVGAAAIMCGIFAIFAGLCWIIGRPAVKKFVEQGVKTASGLALLISVCGVAMLALGLAVKAADRDLNALLKASRIMILIFLGFATFAGILGEIMSTGVGGAVLLAGLTVLKILCSALVLVGVGVLLMSIAVKNMKGLKTEQFTAVGEGMKLFITSIASVFTPTVALQLAAAGLVTPAIIAMAKAVGKVGKVIADVSSLKIPVEWDKDGKVTAYRHLKKSDFKKAADNTGTLITILGNAIANVFKTHPLMFLPTLFGKSPIKLVTDASIKMGKMVGSIAEAIANYASLRVVEEWDPKTGKPSKYRHLSKGDFKSASKNISLLITTLGDALASTYNQHSDMFDSTNLWTGSTDTPIAKILKSTLMMGDAINSIAKGIETYANMGIPVYNTEGKVIGKTPLTDADRKNAVANICATLKTVISAFTEMANDSAVMTAFADAELTFKGFFKGQKTGEGTSPMAKLLNGMFTMSDIIKNVSDAIISYATASVPTYNEDGKIVGRTKISDTDKKEAAENIKEILKTVVSAFTDLANDAELMVAFEDITNFWKNSKEGTSPMAKLIRGLAGSGEIVSDYAGTVIDMASAVIPLYKNGKKIGEQLLGEEPIKQAKSNIEAILRTVVEAFSELANNDVIKKAVNDLQTEDGEIIEGSSPIGKLVKGLQGSGEILGTFAKVITDYAEMRLPLYDAKGKQIGTRKLWYKDILEAQNRIRVIISSVLLGLVQAYNEIDKNGTIKRFNDVQQNLSDIIERANETIAPLITLTENIIKGKLVKNVEQEIEKYKSMCELMSGIVTISVMTLIDPLGFYPNSVGKYISKGNPFLNNPKYETISNVSEGIVDMLPYMQSFADTFSKLKVYNADASISKYAIMAEMLAGLAALTVATITTPESTFASMFTKHALTGNPFDVLANPTDRNTKFGLLLDISEDIADLLPQLEALVQRFANINTINKTAAITNYRDLCETLANIVGITVMTLVNPRELFKDSVGTYISKGNPFLNIKNDAVRNEQFGLINIVCVKTAELINAIQAFTNYVAHLKIYKKEFIANRIKLMFGTYTASINELSAAIIAANDRSIVTKIKSRHSIRALLSDVKSFEAVLEELSKMSDLAAKTKGFTLEDVSNGIAAFSQTIANVSADTLDRAEDLAETIDKYTKSINKVKIANISQLTKFIEQLDNLSQHVGNLDKLASLFSEKLTQTLSTLATEISNAAKVIDKTEKVQQDRHKLIDASVEKIKKMMSESLKVEVTAKDAVLEAYENNKA